MTNEAEDAVERLTEAMNDAIADHEDDVARAWEADERPDLWDAPDVTVSIPDLRTVLTALRAQAERMRVLEGERDEEIVRWCARMAEIREASGVGMKPMLDEVPGAIAERIAAAEARAEAAERRAGELEGALETFAVLANEDTDYLPDEHVISLTYDDSDVDPDLGGPDTLLGERFMRAFRRARALLPATQAEGDAP